MTEQEQLSIITRSKFTPVSLTRNRSVSYLYQVTAVKAKWTGRASEVLVRWKRIPGVVGYDVEKTFTTPSRPDTVWQTAGSTTRSKIILDGIPEFSRAWVRVTARGYGDKRNCPSDPALCAIL